MFGRLPTREISPRRRDTYAFADDRTAVTRVDRDKPSRRASHRVPRSERTNRPCRLSRAFSRPEISARRARRASCSDARRRRRITTRRRENPVLWEIENERLAAREYFSSDVTAHVARSFAHDAARRADIAPARRRLTRAVGSLVSMITKRAFPTFYR